MNTESSETNILDQSPFAWIIAVLIVFSLVTYSLGTLPDIDESTLKLIEYSEYLIIVLFTAEYLYRLVSAKQKLRFVFSFYGIIDLLAIVPFFLATAIDLRSVRLLRFLRLLRLLKLIRYNRALVKFGKALYIAKEELTIFMFVTVVLLYLAAVGIYHFENAAQPDVFRSIFDCLWWAVATLTTVGYGEIYPITTGGRVFTFFVLMIGLGMVAVPTGIVASALTECRRED